MGRNGWNTNKSNWHFKQYYFLKTLINQKISGDELMREATLNDKLLSKVSSNVKLGWTVYYRKLRSTR